MTVVDHNSTKISWPAKLNKVCYPFFQTTAGDVTAWPSIDPNIVPMDLVPLQFITTAKLNPHDSALSQFSLRFSPSPAPASTAPKDLWMIYSIPDITAIEFLSLILHVHLENDKDGLAWFVLYSRKFIINVESVTFSCLLNSSQPWSLSWGIQVACCYWHLPYSSSLYSQLERGESRKIALWLQALLHINNNRTKQILHARLPKDV